jgi:hypothetical protein
MKTAKLFQNGQSQAVRLPKEFRFEGEEVWIKKWVTLSFYRLLRILGGPYLVASKNFPLILWKQEINRRHKKRERVSFRSNNN